MASRGKPGALGIPNLHLERIPGQVPLAVVAKLHGRRLRRCTLVLLQVTCRTEQSTDWFTRADCILSEARGEL